MNQSITTTIHGASLSRRGFIAAGGAMVVALSMRSSTAFGGPECVA